LADYLQRAGIDLLVDATHPFAQKISRQARLAAGMAGVPRLQLVRPSWQPAAGDRWIAVADLAAAAAALPDVGRRAFIATGAGGLAAFSSLDGVMMVVRLIAAPRAPLPFAPHAIVLDRGPFTLDGERRLLHRYAIDVVVSKASGGEATSAKLQAAREAAIPVIMVERPPPEAGARASNVEDALAWIAAELGTREMSG
jgi:precorrin-6A/cobalt-precorrin-6A reductase